MRIVVRNLTQRILIACINSAQWLLRSKIMLFSFFMSQYPVRYIHTRGKISGVDYVIHAKDQAVGRRIFIGRDDEHLKAERAIAWIKDITSVEINTIIDVGANIGHLSIPLLKHGVVSKAYCYEPEPENYKLLQVNLLLNDVAHKVICERIALTIEDSQFFLELSEDNFGDHRIRKSNLVFGKYNEEERRVVSVRGRRLDAVLPPASIVDRGKSLLWLDVQGFEGEVLLGGSNFVKGRNPLALEFWPYGLNRVGGVAELVSILACYGVFFDLSLIEPRPQPINDLSARFYSNVRDDRYSMDILLL